jgi:hypothetical protein
MKIGDIYYINFPFDVPSTSLLHPLVASKTAVSRTNDPCIIYIDVSEDLNLDHIVQHKEAYKLKSTGIQIFLFEWLHHLPNGDKGNRSWYHECEYDSTQHINLRSKLLSYLKTFSLRTGIHVTVNACEYNISTHFQKIYKPLTLRCLDIQNQIETLGLDIQNITIPPKEKILYKFWCATNRYTTYRHIIMSYLADKPGRYSWRFDCDRMCDEIPFLKNLPWEKLKAGNDILNSNDWFVDQKTEKVFVTDPYSDYTANFVLSDSASGTEGFQSSFFNSFVAVVNETVCFQPTTIITEKTLNPMYSMIPFIMVSAPFTLEYLHRLGFKTFGNWWDESYDIETDHEKRILKIFNVIDYVNSKSIEELSQIYKEMKDVLEWNRKCVCDFYKDDKVLP